MKFIFTENSNRKKYYKSLKLDELKTRNNFFFNLEIDITVNTKKK